MSLKEKAKQLKTDIPAVFLALKDKKSLKVISKLLKKGVSVRMRNRKGETALMMVNNKEEAKLLIEKGAGLDDKDIDGKTALMKIDDLDVMKVLIDAGADIDAVDRLGKTAVFWAAEKEDWEKVRFLTRNGADLEIKDNRNWSLFDLFKKNKKVQKMKAKER